jgi:D-psicose/D-tagatose/L-ribulose 3-epimerase
MRFGICGSMVARQPDGSGIEIINEAREIGYDYLELSLAHLATLPEDGFAEIRRRAEASRLPVEACNNFFPRSVRLTGAEVNWAQVSEYIHKAVSRAADLGVRVIVFGSSAAKNVPVGFPTYRAWQQIERVLRLADSEASPRGITIAIEPINHQESNILHSVAEGLALMRRVNLPGVRVLADYYHMAVEKEDPAILITAGPDLCHVHFARLEGRLYPCAPEPGFSAFFRQVAAAGYCGRISVEGFSTDFRQDATCSLALMKRMAGQ